jgi:hypothetical protein
MASRVAINVFCPVFPPEFLYTATPPLCFGFQGPDAATHSAEGRSAIL